MWPIAVIAVGGIVAAGAYWRTVDGKKPVTETTVAPNALKQSTPAASAARAAPAYRPSNLRTGLPLIRIPPAQLVNPGSAPQQSPPVAQQPGAMRQ